MGPGTTGTVTRALGSRNPYLGIGKSKIAWPSTSSKCWATNPHPAGWRRISPPSLQLRLVLELPGHQLLDRLAGVLALVQDGDHLAGDRHLDPALGGEAGDGERVADALGHHGGAAGDLFEALALGELQAGATVARETTGAGQD